MHTEVTIINTSRQLASPFTPKANSEWLLAPLALVDLAVRMREPISVTRLKASSSATAGGHTGEALSAEGVLRLSETLLSSSNRERDHS